jgi:hypothetical protein
MMQSVVDHAKWKIGEKIQVGFINNANALLFRTVSGEDEGFKLGYSDAKKKTGGRIGVKSFVRNYLATVVTLPKKNLSPIFLTGTDWQMALFLEPIKWSKSEFSKSGLDALKKDDVGAYELLGTGDAVLRIGEGRVRDRINAHLQDQRFAPPTVKAFRCLLLSDAEDSKVLERILIDEYINNIGVLPRFQEIKA